MDYLLDYFDNTLGDQLWAYLKPVRLPDAEYLRAQGANFTESYFSTAAAVTSGWAREDWRRQFISLFLMTFVGIHIMYFAVAGLSYKYLFDHRMMKHPRFIKGQVRLEIIRSLWTFPTLTAMTVPFFVGEAQGWSMLYDRVDQSPVGGGWKGWAYLAFSCAFFLWFTDLTIYIIHRWEHLPSVYKHIHKPHHRWIIPTPFASHAFHPVDGFAQALPYHIYVYLFPLHKPTYLLLFVFVNLWTIMIHDSDMITDHPLEEIVNGPAHHTLHHLYFNCNYGQYFTWADIYWKSYRQPAKDEDPLLVVLAKQQKIQNAEAVARQEAEGAEALAISEGEKKEQ